MRYEDRIHLASIPEMSNISSISRLRGMPEPMRTTPRKRHLLRSPPPEPGRLNFSDPPTPPPPPVWNEDRQVVMATIRCEVLGDAVGGERRLEGRCELRIPIGGLVLMLPAVGEQPPVALLLSIHSR